MHCPDVCSTVTDIPQSECLALTSLYDSTQGSDWTYHTRWMGQGDTSLTTVCDWYGVTCSDGHLTALSLSGNNLQGTLPDTLWAISSLTTLYVANNLISSIS